MTRAELDQAVERLDSKLDQAIERLDAKLDLALARLDARFAQMETLIERSTVTSIRWIVGMTLPLYAMLFGFMLFILARELARP